jgi:hypothetical protein
LGKQCNVEAALDQEIVSYMDNLQVFISFPQREWGGKRFIAEMGVGKI